MASIKVVPRDGAEAPNLKGCVLLVAAVTIGNVPQMACDLLTTSCGGRAAAHLRSPALLPFAGRGESGELLTAAELYELTPTSDGRRTLMVQHRSPPARGRASEYARALVAWAAAKGVCELVVLASANAAGRRDAQLQGGGNSVVRVVRGAHAPDKALVAAAAGAPLEGCDADGVWRDDAADVAPAFVPLRRPASFVRSAVDAAAQAAMACSVLLAFAHEGDNALDALAFAACVADAAKLEVRGAPETTSREALMRCFVPPDAWAALAPPPPGLY